MVTHVCLSICLSVCLIVWLCFYVYLFRCLEALFYVGYRSNTSKRPSMALTDWHLKRERFVTLCEYLYFPLTSACLFVCLLVCLSSCLSVCLSICLSVCLPAGTRRTCSHPV